MDFVSAPRDYDELYRRYFDFIQALCRKAGIDRQNVEDAAHEIIARFMERGFLEVFDSKMEFEFDGETRPARFKSFLASFALTYLQGFRDKQKRLKDREVPKIDKPLGPAYGGDGLPVTWGIVHAPTVPGPEAEVLDALNYPVLRRELEEYIAYADRPSPSCDLHAIFTEMMRQFDETERIDPAELRKTFGISNTAVYQWLWRVRKEVADCTGLPLPDKRPRSRVKLPSEK